MQILMESWVRTLSKQTNNITEGCVEGLASLARLHTRSRSRALAIALKDLECQRSGFKYSIFN